MVRPDPATRPPAPVAPLLSYAANGPRRMRKTLGICPTGSVKSNPGTRSRGRNPIAEPAPRFSPTRIYPECSARKRRHTRPVYPGGALRIDSLSFGDKGVLYELARATLRKALGGLCHHRGSGLVFTDPGSIFVSGVVGCLCSS